MKIGNKNSDNKLITTVKKIAEKCQTKKIDKILNVNIFKIHYWNKVNVLNM